MVTYVTGWYTTSSNISNSPATEATVQPTFPRSCTRADLTSINSPRLVAVLIISNMMFFQESHLFIPFIHRKT